MSGIEQSSIHLKFGAEMRQSKVRESVFLPHLGNQS